MLHLNISYVGLNCLFYIQVPLILNNIRKRIPKKQGLKPAKQILTVSKSFDILSLIKLKILLIKI